jgi:hypothetical protein
MGVKKENLKRLTKLEILIPLILETASAVSFFPAFKILKGIRVELEFVRILPFGLHSPKINPEQTLKKKEMINNKLHIEHI